MTLWIVLAAVACFGYPAYLWYEHHQQKKEKQKLARLVKRYPIGQKNLHREFFEKETKRIKKQYSPPFWDNWRFKQFIRKYVKPAILLFFGWQIFHLMTAPSTSTTTNTTFIGANDTSNVVHTFVIGLSIFEIMVALVSIGIVILLGYASYKIFHEATK